MVYLLSCFSLADDPWHLQLREAYKRLLLDLQARHGTEVDLMKNKVAQEVHKRKEEQARLSDEVCLSVHVDKIHRFLFWEWY